MEDYTEGDIWREYKGHNQKKRWDNYEKSKTILFQHGISYRVVSEFSGHLKIGDWNFWPTTGKFYNEKTGTKGRGVFNLIKIL